MLSNKLSTFSFEQIFLYGDCDESEKTRCEESIHSNNCEKIRGVDTCICGKELGCDPNGSKPECVNAYGKSPPEDLSLTCNERKMECIIMK